MPAAPVIASPWGLALTSQSSHLDGVVTLDGNGVPSFRRVDPRAEALGPIDIWRTNLARLGERDR